jgi:hypothetical protein
MSDCGTKITVTRSTPTTYVYKYMDECGLTATIVQLAPNDFLLTDVEDDIDSDTVQDAMEGELISRILSVGTQHVD